MSENEVPYPDPEQQPSGEENSGQSVMNESDTTPSAGLADLSAGEDWLSNYLEAGELPDFDESSFGPPADPDFPEIDADEFKDEDGYLDEDGLSRAKAAAVYDYEAAKRGASKAHTQKIEKAKSEHEAKKQKFEAAKELAEQAASLKFGGKDLFPGESRGKAVNVLQRMLTGEVNEKHAMAIIARGVHSMLNSSKSPRQPLNMAGVVTEPQPTKDFTQKVTDEFNALNGEDFD